MEPRVLVEPLDSLRYGMAGLVPCISPEWLVSITVCHDSPIVHELICDYLPDTNGTAGHDRDGVVEHSGRRYTNRL